MAAKRDRQEMLKWECARSWHVPPASGCRGRHRDARGCHPQAELIITSHHIPHPWGGSRSSWYSAHKFAQAAALEAHRLRRVWKTAHLVGPGMVLDESARAAESMQCSSLGSINSALHNERMQTVAHASINARQAARRPAAGQRDMFAHPHQAPQALSMSIHFALCGFEQ